MILDLKLEKNIANYNIYYLSQNDNLETILLNIIKGSNLYGYSGISPILNIDGFKIIRPLLCVGKDEIVKYSLANNLKYFEDESNSQNDYTRNRLRHHVLPLLNLEASDVDQKFLEFGHLSTATPCPVIIL